MPELTKTRTNDKKGSIIQIVGVVVDVEFSDLEKQRASPGVRQNEVILGS